MKSKILILWLMLIAAASGVHAEEGYAVLDSDGILSFYYDNLRSTRSGTTYDITDGFPNWSYRSTSVRSVVFDPSFRAARPTSCAYWFCGMPNLISIANLSFLNTSQVTDMSSMFSESSLISSIDVSNFDTSKVTTMLSMFQGCTNLSSIEGLDNFDTSNVTVISSMFRNCSQLTNIDVSSFNTEKVRAMIGVFNGCSSLRTLDLSNFTISQSCSPSELMDGCSSLKSLTIPKTANRFYSDACTGVGSESAPCTLFYPSELTLEKTSEGDGWFVWKGGYFREAISEPYALFDGSTLTFYFDDQRYMRPGTSYDIMNSFSMPEWIDFPEVINHTESVVFDPSFALARPTTCNYWFSAMGNLTSFTGMEYFNTSQVTDMESMFSGCSSLTSIDVSNLNTSNVTNMVSMFQECTNLATIIGLEYWNTSNVTNMSSMFNGCHSLTNFDISNFNTSKVYAMCYTFKDCSSLTTLDIGHFNISTRDLYDGMMEGCSSLKSLTIPATANRIASDGCSGVGTPTSPCLLSFPDGFVPEKTSTGAGWYMWKSGYFANGVEEPYAIFDNGTLTLYYDMQRATHTGTAILINLNASMPDWFSLRYDVENMVIDPSFSKARPTSCSYWFCGMSQITHITGLEHLNTSQVTDMSSMFSTCNLLSSVDVSHFDTSNVTDMMSMFQECPNLSSIEGLEYFNTKNVVKMSSMFKNCPSLSSLDVSHFNTENVTAKFAIFAYCSSLTTLTIPATANLFEDDACTGVGTPSSPCTLVFPVGFTLEDTQMNNDYFIWKSGYFKSGCKEAYAEYNNGTLTFYCDMLRSTRTGTTYGMNTGESSGGWYEHIYEVESVVFDPSFADARPTSCSYWFYSMNELTSITGLQYLNTSMVTNMQDMFFNCIKLTSIDVSHFDTSKVTNMQWMFCNCINLSNLDVSHFDTSNVTDMSSMFSNCGALTNLDVSHFNTEKVTTTEYMFAGCDHLTSLDLSSFTITPYCLVGSMLRGCHGLTKLYIPYDADTYYGYEVCEGIGTPSSPCTLVYPDDFTPPSNSSGNNWFEWKSGYFKDDTSESYAVFSGLTLTFYHDQNKSNRAGNIYDLNTANTRPVWYNSADKLNIHYVVFDPSFAVARPTTCCSWFNGCMNLSSISGMENLNTSQVKDMQYMFYNCNSLTNLDVSGFNTANVTNMEALFSGCSGLSHLDVSSFNTVNVTNMMSLFSSCSNLDSLDLSGFNTAKVTNMQGMFTSCINLTDVDVSHFNTASVENLAAMFSQCTKLTNVDVSGFNTENVTYMLGMFYGCTNLKRLDISNFVIPDSTQLAGMANSEMFSNCTHLKALILPETACNINHNACTGVGTKNSPCTLILPDGITITPNEEGDGWYRWKKGYFKDVTDEPYTVLDGTTLTFYYDKQRASRPGATYDWNTQYELPGWNSVASNVKRVIFDNSFAKARPQSCETWFKDMSNLTIISGIQNLNTSQTTTMFGMFAGCSSLTNVDVSHFQTGKTEIMTNMFLDCINLESIDVSHFNTASLSSVYQMFCNCHKLATIDVSNFNIPEATYCTQTFAGCSSLKTLDLGKWVFTPNSITYNMLGGCNALESLTIPATAGYFEPNACAGVGTESSPCTLIYPDGFTLEKTEEGSGWYLWKSGYFKDKYLLGDVNHDGRLTVVDVTMLVNHLLGISQTGFYIENADTNKDTLVNIVDITTLVNMLLGIQ